MDSFESLFVYDDVPLCTFAAFADLCIEPEESDDRSAIAFCIARLETPQEAQRVSCGYSSSMPRLLEIQWHLSKCGGGIEEIARAVSSLRHDVSESQAMTMVLERLADERMIRVRNLGPSAYIHWLSRYIEDRVRDHVLVEAISVELNAAPPLRLPDVIVEALRRVLSVERTRVATGCFDEHVFVWLGDIADVIETSWQDSSLDVTHKAWVNVLRSYINEFSIGVGQANDLLCAIHGADWALTIFPQYLLSLPALPKRLQVVGQLPDSALVESQAMSRAINQMSPLEWAESK